jgi:PAS domain S-box-containing protein
LDITEVATARLCERLRVSRVFYGEIAGGLLKVEQDHTRDVSSLVGEHSLKAFGPEFIATYRPGAVIAVEDVEHDPRLSDAARAALRNRQVAAFADAVLFEDGRQVSLLAVQSAAPRAWTARETDLIRGVAERLRSAVKRARAEGALRESEERLRQFGEASQDVLWIRDAETLQWVYLTQAFEETYGLDRETALAGDNMTGWLDLVLPEDQQAVLDGLQQVRAGERVSFEYRIRRPGEGEVRWLRDTDFPMRDETGQVRWIGGVGRDITKEKAAAKRQEVLVNELQHRARNLLGVVTAVADRTVKQGGSVQAFEDRLQALSRAQGLLSKGGSDTVEVGALVRAELAAHADGASDRVMVSGPKVLLNARQVQNFALAVHELTTNAVKYGALKVETGRLAATWKIICDRRERRRLALSWIESGIAIEPQKVARRGYGTELIQEALAYALEAEVDYILGEDGVRCRIELPLS